MKPSTQHSGVDFSFSKQEYLYLWPPKLDNVIAFRDKQISLLVYDASFSLASVHTGTVCLNL